MAATSIANISRLRLFSFGIVITAARFNPHQFSHTTIRSRMGARLAMPRQHDKRVGAAPPPAMAIIVNPIPIAATIGARSGANRALVDLGISF
jgi:hypothetical protein